MFGASEHRCGRRGGETWRSSLRRPSNAFREEFACEVTCPDTTCLGLPGRTTDQLTPPKTTTPIGRNWQSVLAVPAVGRVWDLVLQTPLTAVDRHRPLEWDLCDLQTATRGPTDPRTEVDLRTVPAWKRPLRNPKNTVGLTFWLYDLI